MSSDDYQSAVRRLCAEFDLPRPDRHSQDWELEISGGLETDPTLRRIVAHGFSHRTPVERLSLMTLAMTLADDLAGHGALGPDLWDRVSANLRGDRETYGELIERYACIDSDLHDAFALAPLARLLLTPQSEGSDAAALDGEI